MILPLLISVSAFALNMISPVSPCSFSPGGGKDYIQRRHPILGTVHWHSGLDLVAPIGTEYKAPADGVITRMGKINNRCGYIIEVKHADNLYTHSCHMLSTGYPSNLKIGSLVKQGQLIARVGNTGTSRGPHSHFVVKKTSDFDSHMDPYNFIDNFCDVEKKVARPAGLQSTVKKNRGQR